MRTPVIIPAHQEAEILGSTLSALSGREFDPYVAVNGSGDNSAEVADSCGAKVFVFEDQGKLPAIQGVIKSLGDRALEPLIILDADTRPLMPKLWLRSMVKLLTNKVPDAPAVIGGPIIFNDAGMRDKIAYSARGILLGIREPFKNRDGSRILRAGPNMGLKIHSKEVLEQIIGLDHYWPGEDRAIVKTVKDAGGRHLQPLYPSLFTITRMPRGYPSVSKRRRLTKSQSAQYIQDEYIQRAADGSVPYSH